MINREGAVAVAEHQSPGSYRWRQARGLLTIKDHERMYRAKRHPRGDYLIPLPDDLIDGWREPLKKTKP